MNDARAHARAQVRAQAYKWKRFSNIMKYL